MKVDSNKQQGSVVVTAIMIMLVMTLLGTGLSHSLSSNTSNIDLQGASAIARGAAASCVYRQIDWLQGQTNRPIGDNHNDISVAQQTLQAQDAGLFDSLDGNYSYDCHLDEVTGNCTVSSGSGVGGDLSKDDGNNRRYCYIVNSTGQAGNETVKLEVTLSKGY